ncbi:MAG: hypothetical protein JNJ98_15035, partial [Gemmatimonadetes bacterium]|nr:hypothetical protein [Gemmatimonadota bacterium]
DRTATREQLVPIPTGGVFAEAVLGRSNSAEKLDATRFWNWQDSPIPLQPPEIAAINMQSRAQPIDVTPGQLGQPVLNIVNPTGLPDPTGLGAMMGALQNGSMFRDMSGLAATVGLAQASGNNATSANAESQKLAAANLAVAAQKDVEEKRIAAQVALGMAGVPAAGGTPKNVSEMGALLNTAKAMDAATTGAAAGASGGGAMGGGGGDGDGGSTEVGGESVPRGGGGGPSGGGSAGEFLRRAMDRATFGPMGDSGANLILAKAPAPGSGGAGGAGPAQFLGERFFHQQVIRMAITEAAEVTQMRDGHWSPASKDFRALCHRSNGNRDPGSDAEVATLDAFLAILEQPYARFNFVSYFEDDTGLQFKREVNGAGAVMPDESGMAPDAPERPTLPINTVIASRELVGLSTSPIGRRLGGIWRRNADFRKQHPNGRLRELYLYLTYPGEDSFDEPPTHPYAAALARLLQMRVYVMPGPIKFKPEFQPLQPNPGVTPKVLVRGQYYRYWVGPDEKLRDLHQCDDDSTSFTP